MYGNIGYKDCLSHISLKPTFDICCLDSLEMSLGACWIFHKYCIFGRFDTGVAAFLESPSNIAVDSIR